MPRKLLPALLPTLLLLISLATQGALAQAPAAKAETLGKVNFPVSCTPAAQLEFNRAMAYFHSFWFDRARASFARVLKRDPKCGMAHWGSALMSMGNPFAWATSPQATAAGAKAAAAARRVGVRSARERDYLAALSAYFKDWPTTPFRPRAVAFENAMAEVVEKHPYDDEAKILYALVLNLTALPADKTFANQQKAAALLEPLLKKYPQHPGVAHYLIHTYDYAELAEQGLPAARAYETIAPSVPHALHMPSHIYSRLGLWKETVEGNRASYAAARGELRKKSLGVGAYDALHAMDYMVFAHLQQAQDGAAKRLVDEAAGLRSRRIDNLAAAYALAAMPARYALERGEWGEAARLRLAPAGVAWDKYPQAEGILVFARALGAARSGDLAAARRDLDRLAALEATLRTTKADYWAAQTAFQRQAVEAWIALAEGRDDALQLMRGAAEAEEASDKHPVTPGNVVPSRQLLGEMLLALGQPAAALTEFARSLERDPNRYRSLYGAAKSAREAGQPEVAQQYYTKLWAMTASRDTDRPELAPREVEPPPAAAAGVQ